MCRRLSVLFYILMLFSMFSQIYSSFEFTNVNCTSLDESFSTFEYCRLKSVNRTYKYGSIKVHLHQVPITKVTINFAIYQRLNGYKPFLYNVTVDGCKFMKNQKSSPVTAFIFNLFGPYSNINHTCPFNDDIILEKVPISHLNQQLTMVLPFPKGDYGFFSVWSGNGMRRAHVNVYGKLF